MVAHMNFLLYQGFSGRGSGGFSPTGGSVEFGGGALVPLALTDESVFASDIVWVWETCDCEGSWDELDGGAVLLCCSVGGVCEEDCEELDVSDAFTSNLGDDDVACECSTTLVVVLFVFV